MKYILPNFFDNFVDNMNIKDSYLFTSELEGIQGTFSFCIFNGSINNIKAESISLYPDIKNCPNDYGILNHLALLDFGNTLIEEKDYHNNMGKIILEEYANSPYWYFEIALESFINYLVEKYPKIQIILHQNYTMYHSEEEIQTLIDKYPNNIKGIIITERNLCLNIKNIKKIYLLSLFDCKHCTQYEKCVQNDMEKTLLYSEQSNFSTCSYIHCSSVEELLQETENIINNYDCEFILFETIPYEHRQIAYNILMLYFNELTQQGE